MVIHLFTSVIIFRSFLTLESWESSFAVLMVSFNPPRKAVFPELCEIIIVLDTTLLYAEYSSYNILDHFPIFTALCTGVLANSLTFLCR